MAEDSQRSWLRMLGYVAFFLVTFLYFVYATFPYDLLVRKFTMPIQKRMQVKIDMKELSPSLLTAVNIQGLNIKKSVSKGTAEVQIDSTRVRLALLPLLMRKLRVFFNVEVARGTMRGMFETNGKKFDVRVETKGVQLAGIGPTMAARRRRPKSDPAKPLLEMLFAPVYGKMNLRLQIKNDGSATSRKRKGKKKKTRRRRRTRRRRGLNMKELRGGVILKVRNLSLGPGYFNAGQMGELPVPLLRLGTLNLQMKISKGYARFVTCKINGSDVDAEITGSLRLRQRMQYSYFRGKIKFRFKKAFLNRSTTPGLLKGAINALGQGKGGFHTYKVYLPFRGRPRFNKL